MISDGMDSFYLRLLIRELTIETANDSRIEVENQIWTLYNLL